MSDGCCCICTAPCNAPTCKNGLHHAPVECAGCHVLAPVLLQALVCCSEVVPGDLAVHVVWYVHTDVVAQELYPARILAVNCACQLSLGGVPL